jgi:Arc/MetJ family transcription regulator
MSRTNIDLDDEAVAVVMRRYRLKTKREAVNFALQAVLDEAFSVEQIKAMRGTGFWDGDPALAELDPTEFELGTGHARTA